MYSAHGNEQEEGDRTKIQLDGIEDAKSEIVAGELSWTRGIGGYFLEVRIQIFKSPVKLTSSSSFDSSSLSWSAQSTKNTMPLIAGR